MQNRRSDDIMDRWWWYIIYIHIVVFFFFAMKSYSILWIFIKFDLWTYLIVSYYLLFCLVASHHLLSYLVVNHRLLSYLLVSHHLLSYLVISSASRVWFKPFTAHLLLNTFRVEGKRQKKQGRNNRDKKGKVNRLLKTPLHDSRYLTLASSELAG